MDKETLEGLQHLTNLVLKNSLAIIKIRDEIEKIYNRLNELVDLLPDDEQNKRAQ